MPTDKPRRMRRLSFDLRSSAAQGPDSNYRGEGPPGKSSRCYQVCMVLFASILVRVGSLPLGQRGMSHLLAKPRPPSTIIKPKISFAQSSASMPDPGKPVRFTTPSTVAILAQGTNLGCCGDTSALRNKGEASAGQHFIFSIVREPAHSTRYYRR
jgi:hypothetical protein